MKAITSEKPTNFNNGIYGSSGKINKHAGNRRDVENEEIQVYLSKLKELVPFMPKNRKLSKLEVIQYVIDYIYDLQYALETHPTLNSAAVHSAAAAMLSSQYQQNLSSSPPTNGAQIVNQIHRQPLGALPPNSNVQVTNSTSHSLCSTSQSNTLSTPVMNKVSSSPDSKTVTTC